MLLETLKFKKLRNWWNQKRNPKSFIDQILQNPPVAGDFHERALWIKKIVVWIQRDSKFHALLNPSSDIRVTRLKHVLNILERNQEWKMGFAEVIRITLAELSFEDALSTSGLPVELSFFGEIFKRINDRLLPGEPVDLQFSSLLRWIFPDPEDAEWIEALDSKSVEHLFTILQSAKASRFEVDRKEALLILSSMIRAIGLSHDLRQIELHKDEAVRSNVFFKLASKIDGAVSLSADLDSQKEMENLLQQAFLQIKRIYLELETVGISIKIVYQLERLNACLRRVELLLRFSGTAAKTPSSILSFFSLMIFESAESRSITNFIGQNISLLAKRIVKTNSEVGEHYITKDRAEAKHLLKTAVGGGMITSATVYFKILISVFPGAPFILGLLNSTNYSLSFIAIQLSGMTLASKQPANTAPALANKLDRIETEAKRAELMDEIVNVIRSQATSILGNIMGVVPVTLFIGYSYLLLWGAPMISPERAQYILEAHDLWGGAWIFAAFTGVLLFVSSLCGGAADNWFKYRKLHQSIARNEVLTNLFGKAFARRAATILSKNFSGIVSAVSLGFLLGLLPEILLFIGLPLEVRHVTLSFGTVAVAFPLFSIDQIFSWTMLRIFVSLMGIGILNVGVSFTLALLVALRAQNLRGAELRMILSKIWNHFRKNPLSFILPKKTSET